MMGDEAADLEAVADGLIAMTRVLNPAIAMHGHAMGLVAARVATVLRLDPGTIFRTEMASRIHDIGLNGVDPRIIDKVEPLTQFEYDILRLHAERGELMLKMTVSLQDLAPIVRSHHEQVDGKGYPDGLSGDEICIESRIIAVADAFHTMTIPQHWRASSSPFAAIQELVRCIDVQFDRAVVNALITVLSAKPEKLSETA